MKKKFLAVILAVFASQAFAETPFAIYISKANSALVLTRQGEVIITGPISFGDDKTPVGNYQVKGKDPEYYSRKIFSETGKKAIMADCVLLEGLDGKEEMEGVFIHQGNTLGKSHGCIRCPRWLALALFKTVPIGTRVIVGDLFPEKLKDQNKVHQNIWVKRSAQPLWKAESTPVISALMRDLNGGVNKGGIDPEYPINLNGLALVLGGQVFADRMFEVGGQFEGIDGAIIHHLSTVPPNKSAVRRYTNPTTLAEGFLFDGYVKGEHFFLWWSKGDVNIFIDKVNEQQIGRGNPRTLRHIRPFSEK